MLFYIKTMTEPQQLGSLATRYAALQQRLTAAVRLHDGGEVAPILPGHSGITLIGASKGQPEALLEEAIRLGLTDFGENKVQEAQQKWPELKARHPHLRLHLIGPLQSNKAAEAVALFDVIQTIDRPRIAEALVGEIAKQGKTPQLLIQVNIGEEPQKSGISPQELPALLAHCTQLGLTIGGLMCVPPAGHNPAPYFALMKKLANRHGLPQLSMGMSGDFESAIRMGATMVRVGTALFGERTY